MNIVLIAPPAAGKGTQAKKICDRYHLNHLSTGDLLREVTKKDDQFSNEIKEKMSKGLLISDDIIIRLIAEKMNNNSNFVFDGFPRNLNQAKQFDKMLEETNQKIDAILYLTVDKEVAKERITGRMVCPKCNNVYNFHSEDTLKEQYCSCGNQLIKREDDTLDTFLKRFEIYESDTQPILDYYQNRNNFYNINSDVSPEEVFDQIEGVLDHL